MKPSRLICKKKYPKVDQKIDRTNVNLKQLEVKVLNPQPVNMVTSPTMTSMSPMMSPPMSPHHPPNLRFIKRPRKLTQSRTPQLGCATRTNIRSLLSPNQSIRKAKLNQKSYQGLTSPIDRTMEARTMSKARPTTAVNIQSATDCTLNNNDKSI